MLIASYQFIFSFAIFTRNDSPLRTVTSLTIIIITTNFHGCIQEVS